MQTEHLHSVHSNYIHIQHTCLSDKSEQYQKKKKGWKAEGIYSAWQTNFIHCIKKKVFAFFLFHTEVYSHTKESWKGYH